MRVLHLLTSGHAGGIESLCRDIGVCSDFESGFCFFTDAGVICRQMEELGLSVYDLSGLGRKFSLRKLRRAMQIAGEYDILLVHHDDPFLRCYYVLLKLLTGKPGVMEMHACYSQTQSSPVKRILEEWILRLSLWCSNCVISVSRPWKEAMKSISAGESPTMWYTMGFPRRCWSRDGGIFPEPHSPSS